MNTLLKVMKNDKTPPLRNLIVLPLILSPDPDEGKVLFTFHTFQLLFLLLF